MTPPSPSRSGQGAAPAYECLTDETLALLIDDELSVEERSAALRHAPQCPDCWALLIRVGFTLDEPGSVPIQEAPPAAGSDPAAAWTPPAEFDGLRRQRELGRGAMGVVYLAHDISLDRLVAVKLIASPAPGPGARERLWNEARAMARLKHPNVVTVYRTGEVDGRPYIVSEYVAGKTLARLSKPVPWREALSLGLGLARGLAAVHGHGLLHRDLKPSNALIADEDGEVKLLDFGLAEPIDPQDPSLGARTRAGTPRYMAPELGKRGARATARSDLYSLGLMLRELVVGVHPVSGGGLGRLVAGIDPDFAALIERCLAADPAERYASSQLLRESLEELSARHVPAPLRAGNPYRGLAPFEAEHRSVFFGRDEEVRAVMERLRRLPVVLVAGDSGVGKSSLCCAGVLPQATCGELDPRREFAALALVPSRRPLDALGAALAPVLGRSEEEIRTALGAEPARLGEMLRERYRERRGLLLFIDQLEELVTISEPSQAAALTAILGELALPSPGVRVLLAVRGDFLTRVSALPGLGEEVERALYLLRPMTADGVRDAITRPARSHGVVFESDDLIEELVQSAARGEGGLPLLQFALAELWERRQKVQGRITRQALEEMGGVAGALSRHADEVLAGLGEPQRRAARHLLLQLVTPDGTRVARREDELAPSPDGTSTAVRALVKGRLLHVRTVTRQPSYEIAHDSLIGQWETLRGWLDEDIGHRALRHRVQVAAAEWERLGRTREGLWQERQVQEAQVLELAELGVNEHAFVLASRAALRLRRLRRRLIALQVAAAVAAIAAVLLYLNNRSVDALLGTAAEEIGQGRASRETACALRKKALELYDTQEPVPENNREVHWNEAETQWTQALARRTEAEARYSIAEESIEKARDQSIRGIAARQAHRELTYERLQLAKCFHPEGRGAENVRRLQDRYEDPAWRALVPSTGKLRVVTTPEGAILEVEEYRRDPNGTLRSVPVSKIGRQPTPTAWLHLREGSYRLRLSRLGYAPVVLPLLLTGGAEESVALDLPVAAAVPDGYAYVPPGCFLLGSNDPEPVRSFYQSSPLHLSCMQEGYLIAKYETTMGDWLDYLRSLPPGSPARSLLEHPQFGNAGAVALSERPEGWLFSFYRQPRAPLFQAFEEDPARYPTRARNAVANWRRFPLAGISPNELRPYLEWLQRRPTGAVPGARLCTEHEWERAARGADGRPYPHGNWTAPDDANVDVTYGRISDNFGPDEVGLHPVSVSPFGLLDMSGSANEITRGVSKDLGDIVLRGGAWYYGHISAHLANRTAGEPNLRSATVGVRVCASLRK